MDNTRFDGLARKLGVERSRRAALRIAGAGVLAGFAPVLARSTATEAAPFEELACAPIGNRCGRRRRDGVPQPRCTTCCTKYTITQTNGQRRCACMPDFTACKRPDQCCSGVCAIECGCEDDGPVCLPGFFVGPDPGP